MRCFGASGAVLVAAMTFSLVPFGRTARASEEKPAVEPVIRTVIGKEIGTEIIEPPITVKVKIRRPGPKGSGYLSNPV